MALRHLVGLIMMALILSAPARAQDFATLIADRVRVDGNSRLIASGNVEVLHQGMRLQATRIIYDQRGDRLDITGPIVLTDGSNVTMLGDTANLAPDLRDGIVNGARLVLNRQLQLAANRITRVEGRYTQLDKVVSSSCKICEANPTPLWEIRSTRVVHDQEKRLLYFDNAQFRVAGVPVAYLPRLRMPDPTLKRAPGFLIPVIKSTSLLGTGIKLPYFIPIGDDKDITITPYVTTGIATAVELRYRQAFRNGEMEFNGALARDDLNPNTTRGYVFGAGRFRLKNDFVLDFNIEAVSDDAFLLDYDISDNDRLESRIGLSRTSRNRYFNAEALHYYSLRAGEDNDTLPRQVADISWENRFDPALIGGQAKFRIQALGLRRPSSIGFDGPDADSVVDGRDVGRLTTGLNWRRNWTLPNGMLAGLLGDLSTEHYQIEDDDTLGHSVNRITPAAAVELRWPFVKTTATGVAHVIEPVAQLVWSEANNGKVPNEDSELVEFDEGNLFDLTRYPGVDRREDGLRSNVGIGWTRRDPAGWSIGTTVGRVFRFTQKSQFSNASGLSGSQSDWLAAVRFEGQDGLSLINRTLLDDTLSLAMNELRLDWRGRRVDLATTFVYLSRDRAENRLDRSSELAIDAAYRFTDTWTGKATGRYDFSADEATRAGVGIQFRNDCTTVDLSLSRRFTSSDNVRPTTDFAISVSLAGFGGSDRAPGPSRCGL
ncbi:LPS-assembly protein [Rhodobacteraceae bacterium MBR-64]